MVVTGSKSLSFGTAGLNLQVLVYGISAIDWIDNMLTVLSSVILANTDNMKFRPSGT